MEGFPMTIIQQPTLFDFDILTQLDVHERHAEIFSPIDFGPLLRLFQKVTDVGAPISVNYDATIRSIIARRLDGIPNTKLLIQRLKEDVVYRLSLGFLYSDNIPSEATYSRIMRVLSENSQLLDELNVQLLLEINDEFQVFEEPVAIDATAVNAHTKHTKEENPKISSTKSQQEMSTEDLFDELPNHPTWGVKVNSKGRNNFWFGYKVHLAVSTRSQFILSSVHTSAFVSDIQVAIPLFRQLEKLGVLGVPISLDKGYDALAIYEEAHNLGFEPIIPLKRVAKSDGEHDEHYAPTCLIEESYHYDSFDDRYGALKFKRPEKRCHECPLNNEGMCQKIIKIKQANNPRMYNNPGRNTNSWKKLYKLRTSVERVNAYLKRSYQLNDTNLFDGMKVQTELKLIQLLYNASLFAEKRLQKEKLAVA
jgi:transposase